MRPSESSSYAFAFCIFLARLFSQFSTTSSYKYFSGISVLPSSVLSISSFNCEICIFCLTFLRYEIVFHFGLFSLLHSFSLIIFLYFWIFCFCFCFCTSSGLWRAQSFSYTVVYICMYVCMFACGNRYVCKHEVNIEINSVFFFLFDSSESTHSQSDLAAMWTPVATTAISKANAKLHFKFDFFFTLSFEWFFIFHFLVSFINIYSFPRHLYACLLLGMSCSKHTYKHTYASVFTYLHAKLILGLDGNRTERQWMVAQQCKNMQNSYPAQACGTDHMPQTNKLHCAEKNWEKHKES